MLRTSRNTLSSSLPLLLGKCAVVSAFRNLDSWLKSWCQNRKQELRDSVNDVAGMIEDVEEMAILVPQIPTQMVERTADVPQISTEQQTELVPQDQTNCKPTISSVSVQTVDVPVPQVMTQVVFSQVPVPVMPVDVFVPTPVLQAAERVAETLSHISLKMPSSRTSGDDAGGRMRG